MSRKTYNETVEYLDGDKPHGVSWMNVAKFIMGTHDEEWYREVPYQVKKIAVRDCTASFITGAKKTKKSGEKFELHHRGKHDPKQSCFIPKSALNQQGIYYTIAGNLKFAEREYLQNEHGDCRLLKEYGRWYIIVPLPFEKSVTVTENQGIVALDPGVRSFLTYFSDDGHFGQFGNRCVERLIGLELKVDALKSIRSHTRDKHKKCNLSRSINRAKARIADLVDELHWKCAVYLASNYSVIFLPTYETSEMVQKGKRKLRKGVVRAMNALSPYKFSVRLEEKCKEYGCRLIRCNEAYTSKTNSFTGELMNIGSREWFKYDGVTVNRDINGARNILIRAMRDTSALGCNA